MLIRSLLCLAVIAGLAMVPAQGALITSTLGTPDFGDGAIVTTAAFLAAGAGEPVPFDGVFIGSDVGGSNFDASWTFAYGAVGNPILSATLTLGIFDHDSAATGSQVSSFTLNVSENQTALMDTQFEGSTGAQSQVRIYTLVLPASTFAQLATGTAIFRLILQGPGIGILGETEFNGAALDFASLNVTTEDLQEPIPEPASVALGLTGLCGLTALRVYRRRQEGHSISK